MSVCPVKKLECLTLQADLTVLHSCYFVALCLSLLICVSSDVRQEYVAKILFFLHSRLFMLEKFPTFCDFIQKSLTLLSASPAEAIDFQRVYATRMSYIRRHAHLLNIPEACPASA